MSELQSQTPRISVTPTITVQFSFCGWANLFFYYWFYYKYLRLEGDEFSIASLVGNYYNFSNLIKFKITKDLINLILQTI